MNLKHLTDKALLVDTKYLVTREREFLTKILHHLKEIDRRKLYSDLGYSSLFEYCLRELGYSEGGTQRRIQACRLLADIPEIEEKIENGLLNLANISQASQFFRGNQVDTVADKKNILEQLEKLSRKEGDKMLCALSGVDEKPQKETKKRVSGDSTKVSIFLTDEIIAKCEQLQDFLGKYMSYQELINYMVDISLVDIQKKKFKVFSLSKDSPPPVAVNRVIRASVKREVYLRDQKCQKCGSIHNLNYDHQIPFALGGKSDVENIRLLCFNCNQRAKIRAKI